MINFGRVKKRSWNFLNPCPCPCWEGSLRSCYLQDYSLSLQKGRRFLWVSLLVPWWRSGSWCFHVDVTMDIFLDEGQMISFPGMGICLIVTSWRKHFQILLNALEAVGSPNEQSLLIFCYLCMLYLYIEYYGMSHICIYMSYFILCM